MTRVLIVDDEEMYRKYLSQILEIEGCIVKTAATGSAAREIARDFAPDVLIIDWLLAEDRRGTEIAQELQSMHPGMRTIMITGYSADEISKSGITAPVFRLVEKPFRLETIVSAVNDALAAC
ncbi:MAG TPA: response regulator [Phycisphaerae bacterium]|nr:response regulator [Phycisphaerae bacterium]HRY67914.1 response regulator [Phycisphaerae bacterium]HSA26073.1 response regulator [Phycisphaerae bacterium]